MKATGIVRRIDDLGRIVIPKEIRNTLRLREGDPMKIFIGDSGEVIFKKHSAISELGNLSQEYVDSLCESTGHIACIADTDQIIAVSSIWKIKFMNSSIDDFGDINNPKQVNEDKKVFSPIIVDDEIVGAIILLAKENCFDSLVYDKFGELEFKIVEIVAGLLAKQMSGY